MHRRPAGWESAAPSTTGPSRVAWWKALRLSTLLLLSAAAPHSGYDDASPAVRAMQDDDGANPAMLWVAAGLTLWTGWDYLHAGLRHASAPGAPVRRP